MVVVVTVDATVVGEVLVVDGPEVVVDEVDVVGAAVVVEADL